MNSSEQDANKDREDHAQKARASFKSKATDAEKPGLTTTKARTRRRPAARVDSAQEGMKTRNDLKPPSVENITTPSDVVSQNVVGAEHQAAPLDGEVLPTTTVNEEEAKALENAQNQEASEKVKTFSGVFDSIAQGTDSAINTINSQLDKAKAVATEGRVGKTAKSIHDVVTDNPVVGGIDYAITRSIEAAIYSTFYIGQWTVNIMSTGALTILGCGYMISVAVIDGFTWLFSYGLAAIIETARSGAELIAGLFKKAPEGSISQEKQETVAPAAA